MKMMKMKSAMAALAVMGMTLFAASGAQAALIGFDLETSPDIVVGTMAVTYDATTDALTMYGAAQQLKDDDSLPHHAIAGAHFSTVGEFSLNATVDDAGNLLGGTFTINGSIPTLSIADGLLLSGTLTAMGSTNGAIDFLYSVTGGALSPLYEGAPAGGIIANAINNFDGTWDQDFTNEIAAQLGTAAADVGVTVPTPSAAAAGLGLLGTLALRRRRRA